MIFEVRLEEEGVHRAAEEGWAFQVSMRGRVVGVDMARREAEADRKVRYQTSEEDRWLAECLRTTKWRLEWNPLEPYRATVVLWPHISR